MRREEGGVGRGMSVCVRERGSGWEKEEKRGGSAAAPLMIHFTRLGFRVALEQKGGGVCLAECRRHHQSILGYV
jgi:hypothetical protein